MASTAWMQRARRHWQRPTTRVSLAAVPLTIAAIYLLGRSGVVSEVPLWALLLVLPAASIQSQVFRLRWDVEPSTARMHQLIASNTVGTGVVMYMTGWGPALAFAFALTAHDVISDAGSKAWRPALAWSLVAMACGEAAIWGGLAPTMIGRPEVDGLAALSALGLSFILAALGLNAARAEAAEESLRESEESFRLLFARNPQPMWLFDVETLTIVEVNEAAIDHYGYTGDQFRSMTITDLRPEEDRLAVVDAVGRRTEGVRHAGVWRHLTASGDLIDVEITSHRLHFMGRPCGLVLANDVTERLRAERELTRLALHDSLTGLPNRALLADRLERALTRAPQGGDTVGVIFLDLDRFKTINDGRGHAGGDELLIQVARRLERVASTDITVARIGGDEFVLLVDGRYRNAEQVAQQVSWALEPPFEIAGSSVFVTASQGIALAQPGDTADDLLAKADAAMYAAKESGRATAVLADETVLRKAAGQLDLELALRHAVSHDELELHYQPIVALATGAIVGAEALVRWGHPERGLLSPAEFIPAAEQSGLIVPIGEWVLHHAIADALTWGGMGVAVNLSPRQLLCPELPSMVRHALAGFDPSLLHLEVTESLLVKHVDRAVAVLGDLRDLGIRVAVDDFGTGYASLGYLQDLPVDILKIDRKFIERLDRDADSSIVATVLTLARLRGLEVIAEGVETDAQLAALVELDCPMAQGFLLGRPVPVDQLRTLFSTALAASKG